MYWDPVVYKKWCHVIAGNGIQLQHPEHNVTYRHLCHPATIETVRVMFTTY